jgi:putrescine aminotransferase
MIDPDAAFQALRLHASPGSALAAKLTGGGAVELSAQGAVVRLSDGRELIDFGSYGVTLLGHRHPAVVQAVTEQLARMPATTRVLANPVNAAFMGELLERVEGPLGRVWLGSDGADAVELAVKLARRVSGRLRVLAVERAFHGKTLGALALTWNPAFRKGLGPLLREVTHIDRDDLDAVRRETAAGDVAAVIFEPLQGEAGARALDAMTLRRWAKDAHRAGAFVISDEVQAGLRRCGPVSLALAAGVDVDAVLFGKALGGGALPLSALVANDELYAPLIEDPTWHTATFSGHPLACAAGRAALRTIDELAPAAVQLGEHLQLGLERLAGSHPEVVRALHGVGLLRGIELATPGAAGSVTVDLAQAGVLISPCLSAPETIRLLPPMVTTPAQLERVLAALDEALGRAAEYLEDERTEQRLGDWGVDAQRAATIGTPPMIGTPPTVATQASAAS